ncbi:MAG: HIT family protein [Epulopiscium sp.]|nr:HIT family protein [Candidatus Epulonipiscium sp.]
MKQEDCIFCKIASGEMNSITILENSEFKVMLDRFPATRGHVLIIPKEHVESIFEMEPEKAGRLFQLATQIAQVMKKELDMEGMNVLQNNGSCAGQTVFHFHLHLIPRYKEDEVTFKWKATEPTEEELLMIGNRIAAAL